MLRSVYAPHLGRSVRFGRKRPVHHRCLKLGNYLYKEALPSAPPAEDYSPPAASVLSNIYGNDTLGDCGIAGGYPMVGVWTGNAGDLFTATMEQIVADYSKIGGYVPGDPTTDQGIELQTALNYWTESGFADGTKLLGWIGVDATNLDEVKSALWLFEGLYIGMELPDAWVSSMPTGPDFTWDVAGNPDPNNGHCIIGCGYDPSGVKICTWGLLGTQTWPAIQKYCAASSQGELYVMLSPDQLAKGQTKCPNGVDWTGLLEDFMALGGHVSPPPMPPPGPTPEPTPIPPFPDPAPGAVTLEQAVAWATAGLQSSWPKP